MPLASRAALVTLGDWLLCASNRQVVVQASVSSNLCYHSPKYTHRCGAHGVQLLRDLHSSSEAE